MSDPICKKVRFETKKEAKERIKEIKEHGEKRKEMPSRSYLCDVCKGFHLTHLSLKEQRFIEIKRKPEWQFNNRIKRIAREWINKKKWNTVKQVPRKQTFIE